jgi:putative PIN family toxin of toxin-antitoxin system
MAVKPIQIVLDTNVLVSAARSRSGASFELLRRLPMKQFEINISPTLALQYEEKLKSVLIQRGVADLSSVEKFVDRLLFLANRRTVNMSLFADDIEINDQFVFDLAIASRSRFIVTYNIRDFSGAVQYGIMPIRPPDFLRLLERLS